MDLLRQPIELETLDILTMVHDVIADRVDSHKKLRQAVFLLRSPQVQMQTRVYADAQMSRWNIDSLQLHMTLADVYYQTSAYLELVWTDRVDLTLNIDHIRWQGIRRLQTQGCQDVHLWQLWATWRRKGQVVGTYDLG